MPYVTISRAARRKAPIADRESALPTLTRFTPISESSERVSRTPCSPINTFTGRSTEPATEAAQWQDEDTAAVRSQLTNDVGQSAIAAINATYMITAWQDLRRDPAIGGSYWDIYAGRNSPPPGRPSLIFLQDRAIINNAPAPTFYWGIATGATEYGLEIDDDIFTSLIINRTGLTSGGSSGSWTLDAGENALLAEGNFYWRMRAYNGFGTTVSETREFMVDNTSPPAPALIAPPNGGTAGETPTFDWSDVSEIQ